MDDEEEDESCYCCAEVVESADAEDKGKKEGNLEIQIILLWAAYY